MGKPTSTLLWNRTDRGSWLQSHRVPVWSLRAGYSTRGHIQQFLQPLLAWLLKLYISSPGFRHSSWCWDLWFSITAIPLPNDWHLTSANNSNTTSNNNDENNKNNNSDSIAEFLLSCRECTHLFTWISQVKSKKQKISYFTILQMRGLVLSHFKDKEMVT